MKTVKRIIRAILRRVHFVSLNVWIPIRRTWTKEPKRFCIACGRNVPRLLPYRGGTTPGFIDAVAVVGSDVQNFSCPRCWSHDRERHLLLFFEAFELRPKVTHKRVLHFAPEHSIRKLVESCGPSEYIRADLLPVEPEVQRLDICELPFEDGAFGLLIANHVLEHVADDRRALCEIARVLEPGGIAILQTPFASRLSATLELPQLDDPAIRLQLYGQEDHLRLYGSDIFERFSIGGLVAINASHDNLLPECDAGKFGVNRAEPLMAFRKDGAR